MAGENAGAGQGSATPDAGISLDDFASDVFGDLSESGGESQPVVTTDAAGAPPAERQAAPDGTAPEGTAPAERAGAPSADATKADLDKGATLTTDKADETDPLATATPFTYAVNGQDKTFDGIRVLGDAGAIISAEALPLLQRRLGERDNLYEQNRTQYDQVKDFEKLSEWRTQGTDGKEQILSGRDGLVEMRVSHSKLEAAFDTLVSAFKPDKQGNYSLLESLIDVDPATSKIVVNQQALDYLTTRADLAEVRAAETVSRRLAEITQAPKTTSGRSGESPSQFDPAAFQAEAPRIIEAAAKELGLDSKLLSDKDKAFLGSQLPRYLRTVTEDDRRDNLSLKVGNPIVDGSFTQVVRDRAEMRREMATTAQATTNAARENAARLAAAALGTRTSASTPSTSRTQERQPTVESDRVSDADKAWALRERHNSGRFSE